MPKLLRKLPFDKNSKNWGLNVEKVKMMIWMNLEFETNYWTTFRSLKRQKFTHCLATVKVIVVVSPICPIKNQNQNQKSKNQIFGKII
jgi:hypothetical protein